MNYTGLYFLQVVVPTGQCFSNLLAEHVVLFRVHILVHPIGVVDCAQLHYDLLPDPLLFPLHQERAPLPLLPVFGRHLFEEKSDEIPVAGIFFSFNNFNSSLSSCINTFLLLDYSSSSFRFTESWISFIISVARLNHSKLCRFLSCPITWESSITLFK